jgi:sugar phosphate isomerase/epimerase
MTTSAVAIAGVPALPNGEARQSAKPDAAKLARVAIMTYSFDRILRMPGRADDPARTLDFFDVPQMFADKYGVRNVEVQHNHFASTETAFFKDFLAKVAAAKSKITNINLEFGNMSISAADPVLRAQAIDLTKRWIDHAVTLGSPRVMVNQGTPTPENRDAAIAALKIMGDYGKSKNVMVSMEPRGSGGGTRGGAPPAEPPAVPPPPPYLLLTEIIKGSGTYANVDIGNFGDQETQHAGIRAMFPFTVGNTHVKLNPARYDLPAALALVKSLGYTGLFSIEGSTQGDPYDNVQKIYDVLVANI